MIKKEDNRRINDPQEISNYFIENFKQLFKSSNPRFPGDLEQLISPVITNEENKLLEEIPTTIENENVIRNMDSLKSPGHDGMPALFYKRYWNIIKEDFTKSVQNFFRN